MKSSSKAMIATSAIFGALGILSVGLRVVARRRAKAEFRADDYLVVLAMIFAFALVMSNIAGVPLGEFGSIRDLDPTEEVVLLKMLFLNQFWYLTSVALSKLSILFFYYRIFSVGSIQYVFVGFIAVTAAWVTAFFFATLFQVGPIACNWQLCLHHTTNFRAMYVTLSVTNIVLDLSVLCLPSLFIRKLQMDRGQKIGLVGIFGLGAFCVVTSIARLAYTIQYLKNGDWETNWAENFDGGALIGIVMWSGLEACSSVICASLPCLRALWKRKGPGSRSSQSIDRRPTRPSKLTIGQPTDFRKVASAFDNVESMYVLPTKDALSTRTKCAPSHGRPMSLSVLSTKTRCAPGPLRPMSLGTVPEHGKHKIDMRMETEQRPMEEAVSREMSP